MDVIGLSAERRLSADADGQCDGIRTDSEQELTRLVEKFSGLVFRVAMCHVKNPADADDIMQEAFLALYTCRRRFTDDENIKAWLIRVTVDKCKNLLRSCGRRLRWLRRFLPQQ